MRNSEFGINASREFIIKTYGTGFPVPRRKAFSDEFGIICVS